MGKVLENVLKKELGFGPTRLEKFMAAYMSEVAVTSEVEVIEEKCGPELELRKVGYHAMKRWVERIYELEFLDDNMRAYINDHEEKISQEIRAVYEKSTWLMDKDYAPKDVVESVRGYYVCDNIILIMDNPSRRMITLYTIAFNMPKELELAMITAVTNNVIISRTELEEIETKTENLLQHHKLKQQELIEQKRVLEEEIAANKLDIKNIKIPLDKQKAKLNEQARYLINNKFFSEEDLLWAD